MSAIPPVNIACPPRSSFLPDFTLPRQGPFWELDPDYMAFRRAQYRDAVLLKLFDDIEITIPQLQEEILLNWVLKGFVFVPAKYHSFFLLECSSVIDKEFLLDNGPWVIANRLAVIRRWHSGMVISDTSFDKIDLWFRFTSIPIELVCHSMAWFLGDLIGTTITVDLKDPQFPAVNSMDAVRVKVTIDPKQPIPTGAFITQPDDRAKWIPCTPERVYRLCQQCGVIGHTADVCTKDEAEVVAAIHAQQQAIIDKLGVHIGIQPTFPLFVCTPMITEFAEFRSTTKSDFVSEVPEVVFYVSDTRPLTPPSNIINDDPPNDDDDDDQDDQDDNNNMDEEDPHYSPMGDQGGDPSDGGLPNGHYQQDSSATPTINMDNSSYDYSASFGNIAFSAAPFCPSIGPMSAVVAHLAPSHFLEHVFTDLAKQRNSSTSPILTLDNHSVTWDASILQFEQDDFWNFFTMGNATVTAQTVTASSSSPLKHDNIGLKEDVILDALLQFFHLSLRTFLPCEIAEVFHESRVMGSLEALSATSNQPHALSVDDLHAWNSFLPFVKAFYEANMAYWEFAHFSTPVSNTFYTWATTNLHPTIALGLAVFLFQSSEMAWDLCFVQLSHRFQVYWADNTFVYIPAVDGLFLISPLNWFFVVSLWKWILMNQSLKFRVYFEIPIALLMVSERLDQQLTRKWKNDLLQLHFKRQAMCAQAASSLICDHKFEWGPDIKVPPFPASPEPPTRVYLKNLLKRKAQFTYTNMLKQAKIPRDAFLVGLDIDDMVIADGLGVVVPYQPLRAP